MIYGQAGGLGKNTGDSNNLLWRISADSESIMALEFLKGIRWACSQAPASDIDLNEGNDVQLDMLLSIEHYLHKAHVNAVRETAIRWADSNKMGRPTAKRKTKKRCVKVKRLCEPMAKMRTMEAYRLELKITRDQLFKVQSERSTFSLDKTRRPISLHQLLSEGSRSFTERTRRILAIILSFAVLHLHDTEWLQPTWGSANVLFFPTMPSNIPLRPFVHTPITDHGSDTDADKSSEHSVDDAASDETESDDFNPDDFNPDDFISHKCPILVILAVMLMEVYFATPFEALAKRYRGTGIGPETSGILRYVDADIVFRKCKGEITENSQFHYAVNKCLNPTVWEDKEGGRLDNNTLSSRTYQEVVHPLKTELSQAYSSIPIEDLNRFTQGLDFTNWDQNIQAAGLGSLKKYKSSSDKTGASRR